MSLHHCLDRECPRTDGCLDGYCPLDHDRKLLHEFFKSPASAQLGRCTIHSLRIGNEPAEPERCPWDDWKPGRDVS